MLIVAPMSGHYATLLRGTVERMLPKHDVYITDWRDAKAVPLSEGTFDLDDYIDYLIEFLETIGEERGERPHVLAVCQPAVPAYAATALMNAARNRWRPKTLTMMGGPIDTRKAPTAVNTIATERPLGWFQKNAIATVPLYYPGAGRKVYPGFLQLAGFMTMNLGSHLVSHWEMFKHLVEGDEESATATQKFYDEYRSVARHDGRILSSDGRRRLPAPPAAEGRAQAPRQEGRSEARSRTRRCSPSRASATISPASARPRRRSKSRAALPQAKKEYFLAQDVGHYGIFNGRKWREQDRSGGRGLDRRRTTERHVYASASSRRRAWSAATRLAAAATAAETNMAV